MNAKRKAANGVLLKPIEIGTSIGTSGDHAKSILGGWRGDWRTHFAVEFNERIDAACRLFGIEPKDGVETLILLLNRLLEDRFPGFRIVDRGSTRGRGRPRKPLAGQAFEDARLIFAELARTQRERLGKFSVRCDLLRKNLPQFRMLTDAQIRAYQRKYAQDYLLEGGTKAQRKHKRAHIEFLLAENRTPFIAQK